MDKLIPTILKIVIIFLFLLFPSCPTQAAEPLTVVINEIAWMGTEVEGVESKNWWRYEWIELYNVTSQPIDVAGWQIENGRAGNETLVISAGTIPPGGYFLICKKEISDCDLTEAKLSLHNEYQKNGKLVLRDTAGNLIAQTPEPENKSWPGGDNETKQTMEWAGSNWQTSPEANGSPGTENSSLLVLPEPEQTSEPTTNEPIGEQFSDGSEMTPQPAEYPTNIFINEILPSPEGSDAENEWIELFNANDFEVDLSGWQIRDGVGAVRTYTFPANTKIVLKSFLLCPRTETRITLQNSGDTLELLNPEKEMVHTVSYQKAPLGQSFNRTPLDSSLRSHLTGQAATGWEWSTTLTPEKDNVISQSETKKAAQTSKASGDAEGSKTPEARPQDGEASETEEKKTMADVGKAMPASSRKSFIFLSATIIAIGSAVIVLFLKKKITAEE